MSKQFRDYITKDGRAEISKIFAKEYENKYKKFEKKDFLIINIEGKLFQAKIGFSKDKEKIRKRLKVIGLDGRFKGKLSKIKIIKHTKGRELKINFENLLYKNKIDLYRILSIMDREDKKLDAGIFNKDLFLFKSSSEKPIKLKRFVNANDFFEILGLYQGEGLRNVKRIQKLQFSNNEPKIINKFLDFFEEIGIDRNKWKLSIVLTGNFDKKRRDRAKKYWLSRTRIPKNNLRSFGNTKTFGNMHNYLGTAIIIFDSSVLSRFFLSILDNVELLIKKEEHAWKFFNGLMEADGSVEIKNEHLSEIYLAYDTENEARCYKKFIEKWLKIGTKTRKRKRIIVLTKDLETGEKWNTWHKMVKYQIFKDHPKRREKLISGFLNHKKTTNRLLRNIQPL